MRIWLPLCVPMCSSGLPTTGGLCAQAACSSSTTAAQGRNDLTARQCVDCSSTVHPPRNTSQVSTSRTLTPPTFALLLLPTLRVSRARAWREQLSAWSDPVFISCFMGIPLGVCLDSKILHPKISHQIFEYIHRVLKKIIYKLFSRMGYKSRDESNESDPVWFSRILGNKHLDR